MTPRDTEKKRWLLRVTFTPRVCPRLVQVLQKNKKQVHCLSLLYHSPVYQRVCLDERQDQSHFFVVFFPPIPTLTKQSRCRLSIRLSFSDGRRECGSRCTTTHTQNTCMRDTLDQYGGVIFCRGVVNFRGKFRKTLPNCNHARLCICISVLMNALHIYTHAYTEVVDVRCVCSCCVY